MPRRQHFIIFLILSFAFHALVFGVLVLFPGLQPHRPETTPVRIVNLPPEVLKRLPPTDIPRRPVPVPERFGRDDVLRLPRTAPQPITPGEPERAPERMPEQERGPLPFLTQRDIDEFARKGMPQRKPGDDSVTLDTSEFKFISYNRWLKLKVEGVLRYPEIAAVSGLQGVAYIRFDIMKDGSLGAVELLKSSGYKILDDEALRSIRDSAPFQALPDEWNMDRYPIRAAVIFYLSTVYVR